MAEASFSERWAQKERDLGYDAAFAREMVEYDGQVLPAEAAPFLTFDRFAKQPRIWEVFSPGGQWPQAAKERLAAYRMIGSDGEGSPICIDETTGAVWWLDHEVAFTRTMFVNSSVQQLGECLLAYMGEKDKDRFRSAVQAIDPPALAVGTFWAMAVEWIDQG